jgi:hypothetical protein
MDDARVHVEGLKELRHALGQVDKQLPKNLRVRLKAIGDRVAAATRAKMPHGTGRAASSVKAGVSGNTAYVQEGKSAVPYVGWLDFGGVLAPSGGRRGTQNRPKVKGGRYLYPTVHEMRPETERQAAEAFDETARELGLK